MDKLMNIRRSDRCAVCRVALPAGTKAYWLPTERFVQCIECYSRTHVSGGVRVSRGHPQSGSGIASGAPQQDVAGRSASLEYERRSERERANKKRLIAEDAERRRLIKEQYPVLGRLASAVTPRPKIGPESQATKAWSKGAEGERRVAEVLSGVAGIEVLHDRKVPGSRANIDHIAIGPAGVFVIDAKKYSGEIRLRDVGGWRRADDRLYIAGRDRTKLVDGVRRQVDVVRTALGEVHQQLPVHGVLCFIGCEWGWFPRPKIVRGVAVVWPAKLHEHVASSGDHAGSTGDVAGRLREQPRPA